MNQDPKYKELFTKYCDITDLFLELSNERHRLEEQLKECQFEIYDGTLEELKKLPVVNFRLSSKKSKDPFGGIIPEEIILEFENGQEIRFKTVNYVGMDLMTVAKDFTTAGANVKVSFQEEKP